MTREEKCKLAIEKGYTYNPETGKIYSRFGKEIIGKNAYGYIQIQLYLDNKKYKLFGHQFAWYYINKECVDCLDHINGIKDDNRICNLRNVTYQQNQMNMIKAKGYYFDKQINKWRGHIRINYKKTHLGLFETEEDARNAYIEAKEKYHII
jgi:hypothetical protein